MCPYCGTPPPPKPKLAQTVLGFTSPLAPTPKPAATQPMQAVPLPGGEAKTTEMPAVTTQEMPAAPAMEQPPAMKTMLGFAAPHLPAPAPTPTPGPAPGGPAANAPLAKTMLGFAAPPELRNLAPQQPAAPPQPAAPLPQPAAPMAPPPAAQPVQPVAAKTMLGIAMPGVAPAPAQQPAPAPAPAPQPKAASSTLLGVAMPGIAPTHAPPAARTLLGVAAPGIAPTHAGQRPMPEEPVPEVLPAPAPLQYEIAPAAPVVVARKGVPLAVVAAIVGVLVLIGGAGIFLLSRGSPLAATAMVAADGKEQLHLRCERCPDGSTAALEGAKSTFKNHEADLPLASPLVVGDNRFEIQVDRPGLRRNRLIHLVLPITYRIRGDLSDLGGNPPAIKVQVEATPGSTVSVDGKPVALDASGKATLSYDVTTDVTGTADETRTIDKKLGYVVENKDGKKDTGEVSARVAVLPLHLDAPSPSLVVDGSKVDVAGRTSKGAQLTLDGAPVAVAADGTFETTVDVAPGEHELTLRAAPASGAQGPAPRTAVVHVKRVSSLDAEARSLDATPSLGFDALVASADASLGQPVGVDGHVVDARVTHHQTVLLVDDRRGCAAGPCVVRVVYGADSSFAKGDVVRAYGRVAKTLTSPEGKTVPQVDAALVVRGRK